VILEQPTPKEKLDKIRQPFLILGLALLSFICGRQNEPFIDNKLNLLTDRLARFAKVV
jgi:hypothetical protein